MLRAPSQVPPHFLVPVIAARSQLLLKSVLKIFENVVWSNSLLRHCKIQTLLKINCCMAVISALRVTQHIIDIVLNFSLEIEFNTLRFINYIYNFRLCSTYAAATSAKSMIN